MNTTLKNSRLKNTLLRGTAVGMFLVGHSAALGQEAVDCTAPYKALQDECVQANDDVVVRMPSGENTEYAADRLPDDGGFLISIDGNPINEDKRTDDIIRQVDKKLEKADIRVQFDGLGAKRKLDLAYSVKRGTEFNDFRVLFKSHLNYPAFVNRGELRFYSKPINDESFLITSADIDPNGTMEISIPVGDGIYVAHRVYDQNNRYDETAPIPLKAADRRGLMVRAEQGTDQTAFRNIPKKGGAVTVSGGSLPANSQIRVLGETVQTDPSGRFVLQRILPDGDHWVDVDLPGPQKNIKRKVEIPTKDMFLFALADVTLGLRNKSDGTGNELFDRSRLAFYMKSKQSNGWTITAALDTGEEDLGNLLSGVLEKDPRSLVSRIDPQDLYPSYGDDSTSVDDTPTDGRIYLKAEYETGFILWGNYKASLGRNTYVRNERQLYGAQVNWKFGEDTPEKKPQVEVDLYAARSETLPGREVLRATGGSIYFLQKQDVLFNSETITVELRDSVTNRVIERRVLEREADYTFNYVQGTVLLNGPLSDTNTGGLIEPTSNNSVNTNLVVQYEYAPALSDVDGTTLGGRIEVSNNDNLSVGITGISENTGAADQVMLGADAIAKFGEKSYARVDVARTRGPGFGNSVSTDGGLIINNETLANGDGTAAKLEIEADARDLGFDTDAQAGAYVERRTEGLSTLDFNVTNATGDEDLAGVYVKLSPTERSNTQFSIDTYSNSVGNKRNTYSAETKFDVNQRLALSFAATLNDETTATTSGTRTDIAMRGDYKVSDAWDVYGFVQRDVQNTGLERNNRVGLGADYQMSERWKLGAEISDGTNGLGGRLLATYDDIESGSTYFGFELDPTREISVGSGSEQSKGKYIFGTKRQINSRVSAFAENTLDLFGSRDSLTSAYGVTYEPTEFTSYDASFETGRVADATDGDFDRWGFSLGSRHNNENLAIRNRVEYRRERGILSGTNRDSDTVLLSSKGKFDRNESERLSYNVALAFTDTDQSSVLDGELLDVQVGYALRPVDNDKLNVLFKYRYLADMYGQRVDGTDQNRIRQRSHIVSADASYDMNQHWTVGAKVGARFGETAPNNGGGFTENNAVLGVVNARYHLTHDWDALVEGRVLKTSGNDSTEFGALISLNRQLNNNVRFGIGYNFGKFSDDLSDVTQNEKGLFVNLTVKF